MARQRKSRRSGGGYEQGFSLLEIMVAFAILAGVLGVIYQVFSTGMRSVNVVSHYTEATRLAESLLEEYSATLSTADVEQSGTSSDERYHWSVTTGAFQVDELFEDVPQAYSAIEVAVRVSWSNGSKSREVNLKTLRLLHAQDAG